MGASTIVFVSGKDPIATAGGHETYVRAHGLAARRLGFDPHVFCVGRPGGLVVTEFGTVHRVAPPLPGPLPVWLHGPLLTRSVVRFLAGRPGPHVIHGFGIWADTAARARDELRRRGQGAAAIASAYGTRAYEVGAMQALPGDHGAGRWLYYRSWRRWTEAVDDRIEGRGYRSCEVVLVNYESVRRILLAAYGSKLAVRLVPYAPAVAFEGSPEQEPAWSRHRPEAAGAADRVEAAPAPGRTATARIRNRSGPPSILAISRHDPRKGVEVLLRALSRLDLKGVPFRATVVGPGALLEPHRRLAARLGLDGTVSIPGRVDDVAPYLAEADVYVLPSRAEASGSVSVLEALHAGVAVVASACDGMPEDLTDGRDALLVAPGDPAALARALETVLGDRALRARIAAAGRRRYEERFSADGFVAALAEVWAGARGVVEAGVVADDGEVAKAGGVSATGEITRPAGGPAGADLTDQGPPQRGRIPSGSP